MKKMNINLKEKIDKYPIDSKLKEIAIKTLNMASEGRDDENIKANIEREINILIKEGEENETNIN